MIRLHHFQSRYTYLTATLVLVNVTVLNPPVRVVAPVGPFPPADALANVIVPKLDESPPSSTNHSASSRQSADDVETVLVTVIPVVGLETFNVAALVDVAVMVNWTDCPAATVIPEKSYAICTSYPDQRNAENAKENIFFSRTIIRIVFIPN